MANGGGGQYDLVSASGDADLRLIYGGDVQADQHQADPVLEATSTRSCRSRRSTRSAASTTASPTSSARTCCCTRRRRSRPRPTSWSVIYNKKYTGQITVPDNPIQIADAALYLSKTQPKPRHHRPLRADPAAVQRGGHPAQAAAPADQEVLGPRLAGDLAVPERHDRRRRGVAVPDEHAGGGRREGRRHDPERGRDRLGRHLDARHQGAAPQLRLQVDAVGDDAEGPGGAGDLLRRDARPTRWPARSWTRSRRARAPRYHANAPEAYFQTIKFWKTPLAQCGNGKNDCVPFQQWVTAWTQIIG